MMKSSRLWMPAVTLALSAAAWAAAGAYPLAGSEPDRRPQTAPRIVAPPPQDRRIVLHGIAEPIPASLKFLDDQGSWYTPFAHPGMTGLYDLRGWHTSPPSLQPTK